MKSLLKFIVPFILLLSCRHKDIQYMEGTIEDVFSKAKKENKKVFVLVENSDCGPCKYFAKMLNEQSNTSAILRRDYICYKADILDTTQKVIAQILKCPSYPFPFFFDNDGQLIAFGFPESKEFDISDLSKIYTDQYKFMELFRLPITTDAYKQMVFLNLRSYLLMKSGKNDPVALDTAYQLSKRSLNIAVYPYNIYLTDMLEKRLNMQSSPVSEQLLRPVFTRSDKFIYGNLIDHIRMKEPDSSTFARQNGKDSTAYAFSKNTQDCGIIKAGTDYTFSFEFKNTSNEVLLIAKAEHPCSCIELKWPQEPVKPGETSFIRGVFHVEGKGKFTKEIYVHAVSQKVPMKIIILTGIVG